MSSRSRRTLAGRSAGNGASEEAVIDRYIDDIVARIGTLSRPMRVVYDCGNGAGALVAPQLFARSASRAAACSARATARSRTTIPIRRSPRTSRTSSRR